MRPAIGASLCSVCTKNEINVFEGERGNITDALIELCQACESSCDSTKEVFVQKKLKNRNQSNNLSSSTFKAHTLQSYLPRQKKMLFISLY